MRMYIDCPVILRKQAVQSHAAAVAIRCVCYTTTAARETAFERDERYRYIVGAIQQKYLPWVNEHRYVLQRANGTER